MSSPQKERNFGLAELVLVVAVLVSLILARATFKARTPLVPNPANIATESNAPAPVQARVGQAKSTQAPSPPPTNLPAVSAESGVKRLGLCRYKGEGLVHWRLVHLIQTQQPEFIILPKYHALCLEKQSHFSVVNYDIPNDEAFDYLGDYEVSLQKVADYPDFQSFSQVNSTISKKFGFDQMKGALSWLNWLGPAEEGFVIFKLNGKGQFTIRKPTGRFSKYPGIHLVNQGEAESEIKKDPFIRIIDVRSSPGKPIPWKSTVMRPALKFSEFTPGVAIADIQKQKENLKFDFTSRYLIIGTSEVDGNPFMYGSAFYTFGAKEVMVLKEGARGPGAFSLETRQQYSGVDSIDFLQLISMINGVTVIDTRRNPRENDVKIKDVLRVPFEYRSFLTVSENPKREIMKEIAKDKLDPKFDVFSKPNLQKKLQLITSKRVVVIGENDYDWAPLLVAKSLKNRNIHVSWFRPGFEALQIYKHVGVKMGELEGRLIRVTKTANEKITISDKNGKLLQTTVIVPKDRWQNDPTSKSYKVSNERKEKRRIENENIQAVKKLKNQK